MYERWLVATTLTPHLICPQDCAKCACVVSRKGLLLSRPGDGAIGRAVVQRLNVGYIGALSATRIDIQVDWECNTDAQKEFLGEGKMQPRYEVLDRRDARAGPHACASAAVSHGMSALPKIVLHTQLHLSPLSSL